MIQEKITAPAAAMSRSVRISGWAVFSLFAAYLLWPLLHPVHPEGFTGSVASLGLHLREDSLDNFDQMQPLNVEFFGLSKLGWILLTSALTGLGLSSSAAMTLLTWVAAAAFAAGTVLLVRRWVNIPLWAPVAVLILLPGVSETAFFFNDNIIASAFAVWALLALYLEKRELGALFCGALFAAAVLTRPDTALIGAGVPWLLYERERAWRPIVQSLAIAGTAGGVILLGTYSAFNATIFDIPTVARAAVAAWQGRATANGALQLFYFLGLPGTILTVGGIVSLARKRDWILAVRLLAVPAIYVVVIGGQLWEIRQFLPLTPYLVACAASQLARMVQGEHRQIIPLSLLAGITGIALFGPIVLLKDADGPRVLAGRVANIAYWRGWQRNVDKDFALLHSLADVREGHTRMLISDFWNDDRYSHLVIQEAGYRLVAPNRQCGRIIEEFVNGSKRIVLLRLHQVYVPYWRQLSAERLQRWGIPCVDSLDYQDIALVAPKGRLDFLLGRTRFKVVLPPQESLYDGSGNLRAIQLHRSQLSRLVKAYQKLGIITEIPGLRVPSIEEAAATARKRTSFGR